MTHMNQEHIPEKALLLRNPRPWHMITFCDSRGALVWCAAHRGAPRFAAFLTDNAVQDAPGPEDLFVLWVDGAPQPEQASALRKQVIEAIRQARENSF